MQREEIVSTVVDFLAGMPDEVVCAYLFGSTARGETGSASDLDVAILLRRDPPATLESRKFSLATELERRIGVAVDLVILNDAPADLVHRILRDGRLLLDRDKSRRVRFEVKSRNAYFDLQPILKRYRAGAIALASRVGPA